MAQAVYEIRVAGTVPEDDLRDMGAQEVSTDPAHTVLCGEIADEAALYGLLARLHALHLEVLEFRRVTSGSAPRWFVESQET